MATHRPGFGRSDTDLDNSLRGEEKAEDLTTVTSITKPSSNSFRGSNTSDEKHVNLESAPVYDEEDGELAGHAVSYCCQGISGTNTEISKHVASATELVTQVLHVDDDTSLNPWTFRMWFLGDCSHPGR